MDTNVNIRNSQQIWISIIELWLNIVEDAMIQYVVIAIHNIIIDTQNSDNWYP